MCISKVSICCSDELDIVRNGGVGTEHPDYTTCAGGFCVEGGSLNGLRAPSDRAHLSQQIKEKNCEHPRILN